jgi:transposase
MSINGAPVIAASVVAVDVGKNKAALSVTSADRHRLFGPAEFAMSAPALASVLQRVCALLPAGPVKVGVEAAGHYHRPLLGPGVWPAGWEVLELSPARVAEQRRVQGRRRVKTDAIDLEAITELVLAGHGVLVTARVAAVALAQLLPGTPFAPLTTVPGWGTVRAANYGAAVGDLDRWPRARQLYRASGLSPA